MDSTLSWTKYAPLDDENSILDPLAFDYFAQVLGNVILPSFTSRTSRARYYSMVCYGIYISQEYLKKKGKILYEKNILEAFKLYERYWARAVVENYQGNLKERDGKEAGFRGKRGSINAYDSKTKSLNYKFLTRQLELGGLGAYRSSMEDLDLLKEGLTLTYRGLNLASTFVNQGDYDSLIIKAMNTEKIVNKAGRATLNSFGFHGSLDATVKNSAEKYFIPKHRKEINFLKEYILNNPKNRTAITYIYEKANTKDTMKIIEDISNIKDNSEYEKSIISGFKTVLAFEELAIIINRIWCALIRTAEINLGSINIEQAVEGCRDYLKNLYRGKYINKLLNQSEYFKVRESYHGASFSLLLDKFRNMNEEKFGDFLISMIKHHISVMKKRNSGSWIFLDSNQIIVSSGYNYPKKTEKLEILHGYKISNILSMIKDTGWTPDD